MQNEKDMKFMESYKAFYAVDNVSIDQVKAAYGKNKSQRKYERLTQPPV
jgi:hypothetical protein